MLTLKTGTSHLRHHLNKQNVLAERTLKKSLKVFFKLLHNLKYPPLAMEPKRPQTTYSRKSATISAISVLDPDAALQERIRSVLDTEKENSLSKGLVEEDEFDSAYLDTTVVSTT